ncbi:uncharacterized protein LOC135499061 [Lineus longissimus]|uniref:uncharacterized protein LOC135499061 n=1 Tax=Lineus longissimus TaxID=88925 RepID=UPI002B4D9C05
MHYFLVISVLIACFLGANAYPQVRKSLTCQNVTGVNYPAACPRSNDPDSFTRCCEANGEPSCCPPLQQENDQFHMTCSSEFQRHNVPRCPRSFDPDDYFVCCTETTTVFGVTTITYKCCSADILAGWAIAVIVVAVVVVISLITLCCCCCCSCCFLAKRRAQRGYVIIRN